MWHWCGLKDKDEMKRWRRVNVRKRKKKIRGDRKIRLTFFYFSCNATSDGFHIRRMWMVFSSRRKKDRMVEEKFASPVNVSRSLSLCKLLLDLSVPKITAFHGPLFLLLTARILVITSFVVGHKAGKKKFTANGRRPNYCTKLDSKFI